MKYSVIDTHADSLLKAYTENCSLYGNDLHLDFSRFSEMSATYFLAVYVAKKFWGNAKEYTQEVIKKLSDEVKKSKGKLFLCKSFDDYMKNPDKDRVFLSIEGAKAVESVADLHEFYDAGVRMMSLTWNETNQLASGVGEEDGNKGLTPLGRDIVAEMERLGVLIDVSHANDKTFWDIAEATNGPIIASHSNSRAVCSNKRNLTDEQAIRIKESGGYVGLNLYPPFLSGSKEATIDDILRHADHFLGLGLEDNLGIGADFDGIEVTPEGIDGAHDLYKVFDAMLRYGYSEILVNKISYTNMERILKENL